MSRQIRHARGATVQQIGRQLNIFIQSFNLEYNFYELCDDFPAKLKLIESLNEPLLLVRAKQASQLTFQLNIRILFIEHADWINIY